MARSPKNPGRISSELMKAAQNRISKLKWTKPAVRERPLVKSVKQTAKPTEPVVKRGLRERPEVKSVRGTGLTISQLIRNTPAVVRAAAVKGDVRIIRQQKRKNKGMKASWTVTNTTEKGQARQHQQLVTLKEGDKFLPNSKVLVQCDCGFFKFYCDWVLWKNGASELKESIDEPPDIKNPRRIKMVCKHLLVVCSEIT